MPNDVLAQLDSRVTLLDGGMGSLLIAMGLEPGRAPEWWNLEHPGRIAAAHARYVEAGSDIIHTNTFGATPPKLEQAGLAGKCREINRTAVDLARRAAGGRALVAGDVGPTGRMLPPMGDATTDNLWQAFSEQTEALAEAGVDLISIETMYDLREALQAVRAARQTGLRVLASMTFEPKRRGIFTIVGDRIGSSLVALAEAGADVVGFNCSVAPAAMLAMVREAIAATSTPLVAQPNAGQPRATSDGIVYQADPDSFAIGVGELVRAGARVVGGCCGTDPEYIRALRVTIDARHE